MRYRVCAEPGCPNYTEGQTRCDDCRRSADRARGTSAERGYTSQHRRARQNAKPAVEAGLATCWRCQLPIEPEEPWDLGHDDEDRSQYRGPEHRACNRATKTHALKRDTQ